MTSKGCIIRDVETEAERSTLSQATSSSQPTRICFCNCSDAWLPVSNGLILSYCVPDLLHILGASRSQLTALAIVSHNDYNKNIPSLGPVTNFLTIQSISSEGPKTMVAKYLQDNRVVGKNKEN